MVLTLSMFFCMQNIETADAGFRKNTAVKQKVNKTMSTKQANQELQIDQLQKDLLTGIATKLVKAYKATTQNPLTIYIGQFAVKVFSNDANTDDVMLNEDDDKKEGNEFGPEGGDSCVCAGGATVESDDPEYVGTECVCTPSGCGSC